MNATDGLRMSIVQEVTSCTLVFNLNPPYNNLLLPSLRDSTELPLFLEHTWMLVIAVPACKLSQEERCVSDMGNPLSFSVSLPWMKFRIFIYSLYSSSSAGNSIRLTFI